LEAAWGKRYPAIAQMWRRAWEHVAPFLVVEALHRSLRKIIKTRGSFPNDDAALNRRISDWR
jgi:putative transposase